MNKVILMGNLVKDPELRTQQNFTVCNFTVAVNKKTQNGDKTSFIECKAYNKRAMMISEYFRKGSRMLLEGELTQDTWTDKQTGKQRSKLSILVNNVHFVDKKPQTQGYTPQPVNNPVIPPQANVQYSPQNEIPF